MAAVQGFDFPDDLYYTKEHVWARIEGNTVTIGLSSYGQQLAGEIVYVEVPRVGRTIEKSEAFMSMESGKWVGRVKAPVGGSITEANEELEWESDMVNRDPYGEGWLAKIEASNLEEDLKDLLRPDSEEFAGHISAEIEKYKK